MAISKANGHAASGDGVAVTFDPINRQTVSAEIRQRLVEAIRSGQLAPGSPLPAERVLCQEFGVARTSVREAIQGLVIGGYVERRGNRSVVAERLPEISFAGGQADDRKALVTQLFEVRQVIEPAIAELAGAPGQRGRAGGDRCDRRTRHPPAGGVPPPRPAVPRRRRAGVRQPAAERGPRQGAGFAVRLGRSGLAALRRGQPQGGRRDHHLVPGRPPGDRRGRRQGPARKAHAAVVAHLDDVERRMVERLL